MLANKEKNDKCRKLNIIFNGESFRGNIDEPLNKVKVSNSVQINFTLEGIPYFTQIFRTFIGLDFRNIIISVYNIIFCLIIIWCEETIKNDEYKLFCLVNKGALMNYFPPSPIECLLPSFTEIV